MREEILELLKSTNRVNILDFVNYLENETDFFTAPASTKYHGSFEGGLAKHSYNVYYNLYQLLTIEPFSKFNFDFDSVIICALLHDLCKTNLYKVSMRNKKNEYGRWVQEPFYETDDQEPYGHGEKSVMLVEKFITLSDEERYAIRWHMGAWDDSARSNGAINKAFQKYPLALALHIADMMDANMGESK